MGLLSSINTDRSPPQAAQSAASQPSFGPAQSASAARKRAAAIQDVFEKPKAFESAGDGAKSTSAPHTAAPEQQSFFARMGEKLTGWLHLGTGSLHHNLQWAAKFLDELRHFAVDLTSTLGTAIKDVGSQMLEMSRNLSGKDTHI